MAGGEAQRKWSEFEITWLELGSRVNCITKRAEMFKTNFCV